MNAVRVKQLFIHPVKGLTPQALDRVFLQAGHGIPGDRAFALMYEVAPRDKMNVSTSVPWMKKQNFVMQADWAALAALACHLDPQTGILTVKRQGVELLVASTDTQAGRLEIGAFFTGYLAAIYPSQTARHPDRAPLRLVGDRTGKTRYSDRQPGHLSLINQATLDRLAAIANKSIDIRRFRPNVLIEGLPPWAEFDWVGQEIQLGTARLEITAPINRCLNIDVNPDTGERDISLLSLLKKHFNHTQTGILAKVIADGTVAVGDLLEAIAH